MFEKLVIFGAIWNMFFKTQKFWHLKVNRRCRADRQKRSRWHRVGVQSPRFYVGCFM